MDTKNKNLWQEYLDLRENNNNRMEQWRTQGGFGCSNPLPEIPKALQKIVPNSTRLRKLLKKLLNLGRQHTKMFGEKAEKF